MVSVFDFHFRSWKIVEPRNLKVSIGEILSLRMESGGRVWGPSEVHHVCSIELSAVRLFWQRVNCSFPAGMQTCHRLSWGQWLLWCANNTKFTDGSPEVQGEHTLLGDFHADCLGSGCDAPQPQLLPPVGWEVCDPPTGGAGTVNWDGFPQMGCFPEEVVLNLLSVDPLSYSYHLCQCVPDLVMQDTAPTSVGLLSDKADWALVKVRKVFVGIQMSL